MGGVLKSGGMYAPQVSKTARINPAESFCRQFDSPSNS